MTKDAAIKDAAPTQGADARPVAIVRFWNIGAPTVEWVGERLPSGTEISVYATRDAAPSDSPAFRATVTALVSDMLTAWIADLPISACSDISAWANALLAGEQRERT